jgi:hypothetical protein
VPWRALVPRRQRLPVIKRLPACKAGSGRAVTCDGIGPPRSRWLWCCLWLSAGDRCLWHAGGAVARGRLRPAAVAALVGRRWSPVRTGLAFGAASGNPAPGRGPAGCLPAGLPPGRRPRQGRSASPRDGLRPPLTRPSSSRPRRHRSPGAGEDLSPPGRQPEEVSSPGLPAVTEGMDASTSHPDGSSPTILSSARW